MIPTPHKARQELLQIPAEDYPLLTPDELTQVQAAITAEAALTSGLDYMVTVNPTFKRFPHIEIIDQWLLALEEGRLYFDGPGPLPVVTEDGRRVHPTRGDEPVYNLVIDMPPRHGKSYYVSHHHPAYFLTKYPQYRVILASYEADFAASWGAKARDTLLSWPDGGVTIQGGRNAARGQWEIDGYSGGLKTAGTGGPITGTGGHWIVVDDPVKNAEEALSETKRRSAVDWFGSTLYTRREPWEDGTPGRVIVMATRWHEEDLSGHLTPGRPQQGDTWARLHIQAIFEPTDEFPEDPLARAQGEALCPERVPLQELHAIREQIGPQWFGALYQGDPFLAEGNLIHKPFHYATLDNGTYTLHPSGGETITVEEDDCTRFLSVDLAGSTTKRADFSVVMVLDVTPTAPRRMIVRHVLRIRVDTTGHEEMVLEQAEIWQPRFIAVEDKTFGTNLVQRFIARGGWSIRPVEADKSKEFRAMPIDNSIRNQLLFFLGDAPWLQQLESELLKFPNATHDDMVDALAHANNLFIRMPARRRKERDPLRDPITMQERIHADIEARRRRERRGKKIIPGLGRW